MTLLDNTQPPPVHQLFFDGQVALHIAEVARITHIQEQTLLQAGRASLYGSPPPKLRFCVKAPEGYLIFRITPQLVNSISRLPQDQPVGVGYAGQPHPNPEIFEDFDYLVLSPEDCTALCNRGHVDVSIFKNGVSFDGMNTPRSLPFADPSSPYHRVLALGITPAEFSGHYTKTPFRLAKKRITKGDLFILVSDLSFVIDLRSISKQNAQKTAMHHITNATPLETSNKPIVADTDAEDPSDINAIRERVNSGSDVRKEIQPSKIIDLIEKEHIQYASTDLKLLLESAKMAWGKSFICEDKYPTDMDVAKVIKTTFVARKLPPPSDKPADYLARLIRPGSLPRIPDDATELQRAGRYVNSFLLALFTTSTAISTSRNAEDTNGQNSISARLHKDHQIPKYIADVGARAILNKFSSTPTKRPCSKKTAAPTLTSPLDKMITRPY